MKILGMTCRIEIIVISIILGMLLGGHVLCSCVTPEAKEKAKEGFAQCSWISTNKLQNGTRCKIILGY